MITMVILLIFLLPNDGVPLRQRSARGLPAL